MFDECFFLEIHLQVVGRILFVTPEQFVNNFVQVTRLEKAEVGQMAGK